LLCGPTSSENHIEEFESHFLTFICCCNFIGGYAYYCRDILEWLGVDIKTSVQFVPVYQFLGNVYPKQVLENYSKDLIIMYASIPIDCFTTKELIFTPSELLFPLTKHIPVYKLKFYAL